MTVLPTVLRDLLLLEQALVLEGFEVATPGYVKDFDGKETPVDISAFKVNFPIIGWKRNENGCFSLIADIVRISYSYDISKALQAINRNYATLYAIKQASNCFINKSFSLIND